MPAKFSVVSKSSSVLSRWSRTERQDRPTTSGKNQSTYGDGLHLHIADVHVPIPCLFYVVRVRPIFISQTDYNSTTTSFSNGGRRRIKRLQKVINQSNQIKSNQIKSEEKKKMTQEQSTEDTSLLTGNGAREAYEGQDAEASR